MKDIKEFLYGNDYIRKLDEFTSSIIKIQQEYEGDFDTEIPYYTLTTRGSQVKIIFDEDKDIPTSLQSSIKEKFNEIWN
jgi:hypothetical protein